MSVFRWDGGTQYGPAGIKIIQGSGSPEGVVTAPVGSLYQRSDGGTDTSLYIKESGTGNIGWVGSGQGGGGSQGPTGPTGPGGGFNGVINVTGNYTVDLVNDNEKLLLINTNSATITFPTATDPTFNCWVYAPQGTSIDTTDVNGFDISTPFTITPGSAIKVLPMTSDPSYLSGSGWTQFPYWNPSFISSLYGPNNSTIPRDERLGGPGVLIYNHGNWPFSDTPHYAIGGTGPTTDDYNKQEYVYTSDAAGDGDFYLWDSYYVKYSAPGVLRSFYLDNDFHIRVQNASAYNLTVHVIVDDVFVGGTTDTTVVLPPGGGGEFLCYPNTSDTHAGGTWIFCGAATSSVSTVNPQTVSYQAVRTDANNVVTMDVVGANNFTIPDNATVPFPIGTILEVIQLGAGQTTLNPLNGSVTINTPSSLTARAQYSTVTVTKIDTDTWIAGGDLT